MKITQENIRLIWSIFQNSYIIIGDTQDITFLYNENSTLTFRTFGQTENFSILLSGLKQKEISMYIIPCSNVSQNLVSGIIKCLFSAQSHMLSVLIGIVP